MQLFLQLPATAAAYLAYVHYFISSTTESEAIGGKSEATGDATKSNFDCSEKYPQKLSRDVRS